VETERAPHSPEAESAVLGSLILATDNGDLFTEITSTLQPADFYLKTTKEVYSAICEMASRGVPVDLITLKDELVTRGTMGGVVSLESLAGLVETVPTAANGPHYAKIVREKSNQRHVIDMAQAIATKTAKGVELNGDLEELVKLGNGIQFDREAEDRKIVTGVPAQELFMKVDDHVQFILYPLLARGCLTQLQGDPKLGKSCFAMLMALSCSAGRWVCGRFEYQEMNPCRVGYISYEDGKSRLKRRINEYLPGLGIQASSNAETFPPNFIVFDKNPEIDLSTKAGERRLRQIVSLNKLDVLVIDTFSYLHSAEENSKKEMQPVMAALRKLVEDFPVAVLLIHHTRKGNSQGGVESINTRGRGSSAISAAPDIILDWGARPYPNTTILQMASKETSGFECMVKYMEQEDGSVKWEVVDVIDREDVTATKRKIFEVLHTLSLTSPEGITMPLLRGAMPDMVESTLRNHLRTMVKKHELSRARVGFNGSYVYKLKAVTDASPSSSPPAPPPSS
jgi:RecA-family ATPase